MNKICTLCRLEKSLTEFHNSSRNSCGKVPICKRCACEKSRMHHLKHAVNNPPDMSISTKLCRICKIDKPTSEFWLDPRNLGGRKHHCIDCSRAESRDRSRSLKQLKRRQAYHRGKMKDPAYVERRRINRKISYEKNKSKSFARTAAYRALMSGKLIRKPCEKCGSENVVEMHHTDYDKPLDVAWLCVKCHGLAHRKYV